MSVILLSIFKVVVGPIRFALPFYLRLFSLEKRDQVLTVNGCTWLLNSTKIREIADNFFFFQQPFKKNNPLKRKSV